MGIRFSDQNQIKYVQERIKNDPEFIIAAKFMTQDILIGAGDLECIFKAG